LNGFYNSTGSIDLAARAPAILPTVPLTFIRFRELMSARGNALLQLFGPVENHVQVLQNPAIVGGRQRCTEAFLQACAIRQEASRH
jgi:hypothetical protein